jgi:hypothetical protein
MTYIKHNLKKHIAHASVCGRFLCHSCYACEAVQPLTATFRKTFERSWHPLHDRPDMPVIWANDHFFSSSSLSSSDSLSTLQKIKPTSSISFSFAFGPCPFYYNFFNFQYSIKIKIFFNFTPTIF